MDYLETHKCFLVNVCIFLYANLFTFTSIMINLISSNKHLVYKVALQPDISTIKEKLINTTILGATIFLFPTVAIIISRAVLIGWAPIFNFYIALSILLFALFVLRNKITVTYKSIIFLFIFLAISLFEMVTFNLVGGMYAIFIGVVLSALVFGFRTGFLYAVVFILGFSIIGFMYSKEILVPVMDLNEYVRKPITWISKIAGYSFTLLVILYLTNLFYNLFSETITSLTKKTTDLKETLKNLEFSEERFKQFVNNYPFPITIKDQSLNYVFGNKAFLMQTGVSSDEFGHISLDNYFNNEQANKILKGNRYVVENRKYIELEIEQDLPGNQKRYFNLIKYPIKGVDGELMIGAMNIDSTEMKLAEKKLEISEKKYRSIFEGSLDGFVFTNEERIILECNNSFCEMLGYRKKELTGKTFYEITPSEQHTVEANLLEERNFQETGYSGIFEKEYIHKNGHLVPVELNVHKLKLGDELYYWAVIRNITERKQFDRKLYKAMTESEERERERYARELHDGLGPLLSTGKIYCHTLKNEKNEEKRELYLNRTIQLLNESLKSIKEISNNLSPDILRKYGLSEAIKTFISKIKGMQSININFLSKLDCRIAEASEFTIYRTIVELINNSIKHAEATEINVETYEQDKHLFVHYTDNGKGFDYEQFKTTHPGFGLLSLENRINKIGGTYHYHSEVGKGVNVNISVKLDCL